MSATTERSKAKTLGIIGGIAPESTIAYYRAIVAEYQRRTADGTQPPLIINSIDMQKMLGLIGTGKFDEVTDYLTGEAEKLARAGVQFGIYASNTPHIVFERLKQRSPFPLISIVECAAAEAKRLSLKHPALFGTRFTMQGKFYQTTFERDGMTVVLPMPDEQEHIHQKYMSELVKADFRDETRASLLGIVDRMITQDEVDGLVLGGTELPLLFKADSHNGIPFLDTSLIHAKVAVDEMLRN